MEGNWGLYVALYWLLINMISGYAMYIDKRRAINNVWRISEFNLLLLCLLGGFIGTFLIMKYARHKTLHWQFHFAVILSALIWEIGVLFCLFY